MPQAVPEIVFSSFPALIDQLHREGLVNDADRDKLLVYRRSPEQSRWHLFEVIEACRVRDNRNPRRLLDGEALARWYADRTGQHFYHIDPLKIRVQSVTAVMGFNFARTHQILCVESHRDHVIVAHCNLEHQSWIEDLQQGVRREIRTVVADPAKIRRYGIEFYQLSRSLQNQDDPSQGLVRVSNFEQLLELKKTDNIDANDQHIVNVVDWLLRYAFEQRASDIHIEPRRDKGFVRFRIDGMLHTVCDFPLFVTVAVVSRLKILGRMNVAEKRKPQDGRLKTRSGQGNEVELRLSTLPTALGEKLVMRVFDPDVLLRSWSELGLTPEESAQWRDMVSGQGGIVLVTGPTGSGKTTTLYSTLREVATPEINVCTLEDPIEMVEPAFNQMQVVEQGEFGLSFADGIRALMRQDPDVIMVGEIRDLETADMAIQAALTGHLVLSTLHTNDAPAAIHRLLDLGAPPYLIKATLKGVMAQRLVRTLCPHCKTQASPDEDGWRLLTRPWQVPLPSRVYQPVGCLDCRNTGYMGRAGVYELMDMTPEMSNLLADNPAIETLRRQAYKQGTRSLRVNGARKVASGLTTIEEVLRVTPGSDYR